MATGTLQGTNAGFKFTPSGGLEVTHQLRVELREVVALHEQRRFVRRSLDLTALDVTTIGAGVYGLAGVVRYEDEPQDLLDMLVHGLNGTSLLYYPDLAIATFYTLRLLGVNGEQNPQRVQLQPDRDRGKLGEYEAALDLVRLDGTSLEALL